MGAARRKGKWVGGNLVLGYDVAPQGGALNVNDDEAQRVREIFGMYLEYGSLIPVVRELDRRDWRLKAWTTREGRGVGGSVFTKNKLYDMLTNVTYTGRVDYSGQIYAGEHAGIVDDETFTRVQETLKRNGRRGGRNVRNKYSALLKGIVRCATCDAGMIHTYTKKKNHLYRYYVCVKAHQRGWDKCQTRSVSAQALETAVVEQIRGISRNPAMMGEVLRQLADQNRRSSVDSDREKAAIERELEKLAQEMGGLAGLVSSPSPAARSATDRLAAMHERAAELEQHLAGVREKTGKAEFAACGLERPSTDARGVRSLMGADDPIGAGEVHRGARQAGQLRREHRHGHCGIPLRRHQEPLRKWNSTAELKFDSG